jgi:hypothetical protein
MIRKEKTAMTLPMQIDVNEATGITAMTVDIPVDASAAFVWDAVRDIYAVHKRLIPGAAVAVDREPVNSTLEHRSDRSETIVARGGSGGQDRH